MRNKRIDDWRVTTTKHNKGWKRNQEDNKLKFTKLIGLKERKNVIKKRDKKRCHFIHSEWNEH